MGEGPGGRREGAALGRGPPARLLAQLDESATRPPARAFPVPPRSGAGSSASAGFPEPRFEVRRLVVGGPLWNQRLAAHVIIRSTIAAAPYQNQFAHFLTLRWGRVVDDLILEDTQTWANACERLVAAGVGEAAARPMRGGSEASAGGAPQGTVRLATKRSELPSRVSSHTT